MVDIEPLVQQVVNSLGVEYNYNRDSGKYLLDFILENHRTQMVYIYTGKCDRGRNRGRDLLVVETTVGTYNEFVDPVFLLESNQELIFSKVFLKKDSLFPGEMDDGEFEIDLGYRDIMVEASFFLDSVTADILEAIIDEVARHGDELEYILFRAWTSNNPILKMGAL